FPAFGLHFITGTRPLVNTFIPGQVELESWVGSRQVWDCDGSKAGQDFVEDLLVEALARPSVRQHRDREVCIWQNPQAGVLTNGTAVGRVDRFAVPSAHDEAQRPLRPKHIWIRDGNTRLHHFAHTPGRDNACAVWRLA